MAGERYSFGKSFEEKGSWWLPSAPDEAVSGVLSYSEGKFRLELAGLPLALPKGTQFLESERQERLFGRLRNGRGVTLLNCLPMASSYNWAAKGASSCTYSGNCVLFGVHASEAVRFKLMEMHSRTLNTFIWRPRYDVSFPQSRDGGTLSITQPRSLDVPFSLGAQNGKGSLTTHASVSQEVNRVTLENFERCRFEPNEPQPLEWYTWQVRHFCNLLALLTDEVTKPDHLDFLTTDDDQGQIVYGFPEKGNRINREMLPLFRFDALKDQFSSIAEKWFSPTDMMLRAMRLFMRAHRYADADVEERFVASTKALETLSRAHGNAFYLSDETWEAIAAKVCVAIPSDLDESLKHSLKNRIGFGNQYSMRKRVKLLLESLSPEARSLVCESVESFIGGFNDNRNYLTHYTDELYELALSGGELHWAYERVMMLLRIHFLKELGIDEALICNQIKQHGALSQYIRLYKQHKECV